MTLSFTTEKNGKPTHFVEKIWAGLIYNRLCSISDYSDYKKSHLKRFDEEMSDYKELMIFPKLHTIREDKKDRWKASSKIHFVINNRTPNRFQFAPIVQCASTQQIVIKYSPILERAGKVLKKALVWIDDDYASECLWVNGEIKNCASTIETLAIGDGFESPKEFFDYFDQDFCGKIIHWTDLKY